MHDNVGFVDIVCDMGYMFPFFGIAMKGTKALQATASWVLETATFGRTSGIIQCRETFFHMMSKKP